MIVDRARWRRAAHPDGVRHPTLVSGKISGRLAAALDGHLRTALGTDPDAAMDAGRLLKDDASSRVVAVGAADAGVVIKRFRYPDPLRALRRVLRQSRARRAFHAGHALERLSFPVAPVLGYLERRRMGVVVASWLMTRHVEGIELPEALETADADARRTLVEHATDLVAALAAARIAHGDLKATNLLVTPERAPVLLDLHAARPVAREGALLRDRRRFLRNLEPWPDLHAFAGGRLQS